MVVDDQTGVVGSAYQRSFLRNYDDLPYSFFFESCWDGERYHPERGLLALKENPEVELVLLDLCFGEDEDFGFRVLKLLAKESSGTPVLVMSSLDRDTTRLGRALEEGAIGFIEKHRSSAYLQRAVESFIALKQSHVLLGQSAPLRNLRRQAARLAPYSEIPVLVTGERGTGKERVARYIWQSGKRSQGPFVAVNCGGIPATLFEAEFFGSEKGAFTGSTGLRKGFVERAHGGILFLDEVGNLPAEMQAKLLRVLQDRVYYRVGSETEERTANFQIISATNIPPDVLIASGKMREDFFDRIAAVTIETPPLRHCREDIASLAEHFLTELVGEQKRLSPRALATLSNYDWPGNVRELQRVIQESAVRSEDRSMIEAGDLPNKIASGTAGVPPGMDNPEIQTAGRPDHERILAELRLMAFCKKEIRRSKPNQWRAELMRVLYPRSKAANAKGLADALKRLTQGPWGEPAWKEIPEMAVLITEIQGETA